MKHPNLIVFTEANIICFMRNAKYGGYMGNMVLLSLILISAAAAGVTAPEGMVYVKRGNEGFYLDRTLVTQEAYQRVIGSNPSSFHNCPACPVEQVTWDEARVYCERIGKRLPTEAEWEYAATSGGKGETWAGTNHENELGDYAWYKDNSGGKTHPVGKKKPNGLGLYDMSGNVWEWIADWHDSSHKYRVLRGGSWQVSAFNLRAALRNGLPPDFRDDRIGFRCSQ